MGVGARPFTALTGGKRASSVPIDCRRQPFAGGERVFTVDEHPDVVGQRFVLVEHLLSERRSRRKQRVERRFDRASPQYRVDRLAVSRVPEVCEQFDSKPIPSVRQK